MAWTATVEEFQPPAEGEFNGEVIAVEDKDGQYGPTVRFEFKLFTDVDGEEFRVSGFAQKKLNEKTKLGRWVAAILGHMPEVGEEINVDQLLQKNCRVVIKHKINAEGKPFATVAEVRRAEIPF